MNSPYTTLIILGCFISLASYSQGTKIHHVAKPVLLWKTVQAEKLADVWNIKPEDLETATNIFNK